MNKCEKAGFEHCWQEKPHTTMEYRPDGLYPKHRKCKNCDKEQTMSFRWEDVNCTKDVTEDKNGS